MTRRVGRTTARARALVAVVGIVATLLALNPPAGATHHFSDVPDNHPFYQDIFWMVALDITTGYPDGTFRPGAAVSRQGMAAFLHGVWTALGEDDPVPLPDPGFSDVPDGHPFHDDIAWMVALDITSGFPEGTFRPGAAVSRQGMATFLHGLWIALGEGDPVSLPDPGFSDVPDGHPFHDDIAWMVALDITTGFPDGTFRPGAPVTRQAMAPFLHRFADATAPPPHFVVNTANDSVDTHLGDGLCQDASGACSLRAAILETESTLGPQTIAIRSGIDPVLSLDGVGDDTPEVGDLDITDDLTIVGNRSTVDAAGIDRVFDIAGRSGGTRVVSLEALTISGGVAEYGGGVRTYRADVTITRSTVEGNTAENGGGIAVDDAGSLAVIDSTVRDNTATSADATATGGGIHGAAFISIERSAILDNTASSTGARGGGVFAGSSVDVLDSTFSGNQAIGPWAVGGAITYLLYLDMERSTIVDNFATYTASGIEGNPWHDGLFLWGSILDNPGSDCSGVFDGGAYNLGSDDTCGLTHPTDLVEVDPLLGPLADNGGPTLTHLPAPESPAIDSVPFDPRRCEDQQDQRGIERPQGASCDRGAVEQ